MSLLQETIRLIGRVVICPMWERIGERTLAFPKEFVERREETAASQIVDSIYPGITRQVLRIVDE